jgi:signal transduction histidine kinase/CheY-like chemotaxis protein
VEIAVKPMHDDRQQEEGGSRLLSLLADALWEWSPATGASAYLQRRGALTALPAEGPIAELALEPVHPRDQARVRAAVAQLVRSDASGIDLRYRVRGADGRWWSVHSRGCVVERDPDGRPLRVVGALGDLHPAPVRDEARDPVQERLRQVQKLDALGQLAGGIAHDFNNILASVLGHAELAQMELGDDGSLVVQYLAEIRSAADRGRDLVAQLLRFSRSDRALDQGRVTASPDTVADTLRMLRPLLPATLGVEVDLDPSIRGMALSPAQLQQLVLNLAINARDAVGENGRMAVSVGPLRELSAGVEPIRCASCDAVIETDRAWVALRVADDGPGIPPEMLDRVFDPFFSTKDAEQGSGLGLAVVHGIVHERGGHLLLETGGQGTCFTLLLSSADTQDPATNDDADAPAAAGRGRRLLVVDDEPAIGRWMAKLLGRHGFEVDVEADPERALARFREAPGSWDLVLTDQSMPRLSGVELADELLALRPELPIVVCSGYSEFVSAENAADLGFRAFLAKPVPGATLVATLCDLLDGPAAD